MKTEEIIAGVVYSDGTKANDRRVIRFLTHTGSTDVQWGAERTRLPHGGFEKTRVTSLKSFAKWAKEKAGN